MLVVQSDYLFQKLTIILILPLLYSWQWCTQWLPTSHLFTMTWNFHGVSRLAAGYCVLSPYYQYLCT